MKTQTKSYSEIISQDNFDSRELVERLDKLQMTFDTENIDEEVSDEIKKLEAAIKEIDDNAGDKAEDGVTVIAEDYFVTYAEQLANDTCEIPKDHQWPFYCIDWEYAARDLRMDYSLITIEGGNYYVTA